MGKNKEENASVAAFTGGQVAACYEIKICTVTGLPG
jgi:hypothetical protein